MEVQEAYGVDDLSWETRPVLTGQTPSLQLIGSAKAKATFIGTAGCE